MSHKKKLYPFGFTAWKKVKRRLAKKIIKYYYGTKSFKLFERFNNYKVGDLICACDSLNSKVRSIEPVYTYTRRGKVLIDLDIDTTTTSCSLQHCGIEPPLSYDDAIKVRQEIIDIWKDNDIWKFAERFSKIDILPDGTYLKD